MYKNDDYLGKYMTKCPKCGYRYKKRLHGNKCPDCGYRKGVSKSANMHKYWFLYPYRSYLLLLR